VSHIFLDDLKILRLLQLYVLYVMMLCWPMECILE
jgi:hypothetical protein